MPKLRRALTARAGLLTRPSRRRIVRTDAVFPAAGHAAGLLLLLLLLLAAPSAARVTASPGVSVIVSSSSALVGGSSSTGHRSAGAAASSSPPLLPPPPSLLNITLREQREREHEKTFEFVKGKICIGTNGRMSAPSNREHHYRNLRDRYTNCTYVDGNLELTWLQDENLDLSFLHNIREVTGHVLISHVDVNRIVLPHLQIIRGRTLFKLNIYKQEFALLVTLSKMNTLELPALRDILAGSVGMFNNYNLCHIKTINWEEIITGPGASYLYKYNFTSPERECPPCHPSCEAGCWAEGPDNCQKFSKVNCSPQCELGRCYGAKPRECCHLFCAGGCTGPKQSDCLACRNFYDEGVCAQECPPMQRYNSITYQWEANPQGKYAYGATCVKNCPEHLLKDNGACVRICPPKKKAVNGECVPCDGPCPKTCEGAAVIHSGNIDSFKDCTIIEGPLTILDTTFIGFQQFYGNFSYGPRYPPMHPDRLEVFSTLKEVTEYINIQGYHKDFTNLSYFRNLEVIGGRKLTEYFSSLYIVKSSLRSLGLGSLQRISSGGVAILENKDLCFADGIDWSVIKSPVNEHTTMLQNNKNLTDCIREGLVCDRQCTGKGCWGPGPDQCLECANYRLGNKCILDCDVVAGMYKSSNKVCAPCHEECESMCHGPGPGNCTRCKNVKDGPFCVPVCPVSKYAEPASRECRPCHDNCIYGCTGPENTIGPNGCNSCEKAIINGDVTVVERCLQKNESCPDGYFYEYVQPQEQGALKPLAGKAICRRCHPRCRKCTGYGFHIAVCQECTNYKRGEQCEDECPPDHFAEETSQQCVPCSVECRGCFGPTSAHCFACRNFKIFTSELQADNTTKFNCTDSCPPERAHRVFPENESPYCSVEPVESMLQEAGNLHFIMMSVVICSVVLVGFAIALVYQCRLRSKEKNAAKMSMMLQGLEPLHPTSAKPNLAKLRIVKEAEMRRGGVLGYGAFGTVYKGVWVPEGENVKIPVAIKVLRERTGADMSKEFLDEAYIMASVEHTNLLQLLGVCMTHEMMLVTQLMPLGCLLDYVRNHKDRIGSKPLLNWCHQIARGMAYLEEKRLVHRDLAARNVLVQTPTCVKITDFGLAKLLDINEGEYKAVGGKMPIKWLAPECIQLRTFTHKSDVWAFGVTIWELLTYGGRPYEHVSAREVPELLEKGERLPQPNICTIDVYMLMLKCWMLDAECRPTFKELADEFVKMARDPGRYLVIQGDKLMRLPSYSSQDCNNGGGGEEKVEDTSLEVGGGGCDDVGGHLHHNHHHHHHHGHHTDEYLQPKSRHGIVCPSPPIGGSTGAGATGAGGGEFSQSSVWDQFNPLRYCSDPLAIRETDLVGEEPMPHQHSSSLASRREAHIGNLKLDLPLDEDDYLMPSPHQSQATTAYMDLIGDTSRASREGEGKGGLGHFPDFIPQAGSLAMDNPYYHLTGGNGSASTTGGGASATGGGASAAEGGAAGAAAVAVTSSDGGGSPPSPSVCQTLGIPVHPVLLSHQRSSEEESDHEYYNDFQRELQPLRRNETTV